MRALCTLLFIYLMFSFVVSDLDNTATQTCETLQFVQLETEGIVHCSFTGDYFGVYWYNSTDYVNYSPLISITTSEKDGPGFTTGEFDMFLNGSLIMRRVRFDHAGNYTAVKLDLPTDPIHPHFVTVIVQALPNPPYPVIEGCYQQQSCALERGRRGNLTCSVEGIFPSVDLKWEGVEEDSPITFFHNQQQNKKTTDGRYNVSLTSSFYLNQTRSYRTKVQCRVINDEQLSRFNLSSQVFLFFTDEEEPNSYTTPAVDITTKGFPTAAIVVPVIATVAVSILLVLVVCKKGSRRNVSYTEVEQHTTTTKNERKGLLKNQKRNQDKVEVFKQELKSSYQDTFGSKPFRSTTGSKGDTKASVFTSEKVVSIEVKIPGSVEGTKGPDNSTEKDTLRSKVANQENSKEIFAMSLLAAADSFVGDPTMQCMNLKHGSGTHGLWETVGSITDVLTDANTTSKFFIVEGEFGYGTSTISRQLAYEWSKMEESSLAMHFDILILLRLNRINGNKSINSEIKRLLLRGDSSITEEDIQKVLSSSLNIGVVLDGFNTYEDNECKSNSDVTKIIRREILNDCTIILITSYSCVPNDLKQGVTRLRAKYLDESDQEFLISKEMFLKDTEIGKEIRASIKKNALLKDILKVPFFFAIFLKITSEMTHLRNFKSVTSFFVWIISELYTHCPPHHRENIQTFSSDKVTSELGKLAFEALSIKQKRDKTWAKIDICARIGEDVYEFYRETGIFMEESFPDWGPESVELKNTQVVCDERVRFSHLLFCEWYAARHLSNIFANQEKQYMHGLLKILMSKDNWYCIRFLCGINEEISDEVLKIVDHKVLKILCKLEVEKNGHNANDDIKKWSSKQLSLCLKDSRIQQIATVQLLEIASKKELLDLKVDNCFNSVEGSTGFLELTSGVQLPVLENMKRLNVTEEGREVTNEEATGILNFALRSSKLKYVKFSQCILPQTLNGINVSDTTKWKEVTVEWTPFTDSLRAYSLHRSSFIWKKQGDKLDDYVYRNLVEEFRENHGIR